MKKTAAFLGLILALAVIIAGFQGDLFARLTGTDPGTDVWCAGVSGAEACVDSSGNIVPTTTNDTTLGSSSFYWASAYFYDLLLADDLTVADDVTITDDVSVGGDLTVTTKMIAPHPAIQVLGTGSTGDAGGSSNIVTADACGGVKRIQTYNLASNPLVGDTNNTFTSGSTAGCVMDVLNIGTQNIKLSANAKFSTATDTDLLLTSSDTVRTYTDGSVWYQMGTVVVAQ